MSNYGSSSIDENKILYLEEQAKKIRIEIVKMCHIVGEERKAHPAAALSSADIVAALYFDIMKIDPLKPSWSERDRFILSKGHAATVLYAALALRGYFDIGRLKTLRTLNGILQGHPDMKKTPGVDMTSGSLGHGLSAGIGMAIAAKLDRKDYKVFVILGDGECQEGLVWEAAMSAPKFQLSNLIAIIDANGLQSCDEVCKIIPLEPFGTKWVSFGWNIIEIDGHNMRDIISSLEIASNPKNKPTVIIAHTIKGRGVSFMENDNSWHQKAINLEQFKAAISELGGDCTSE